MSLKKKSILLVAAILLTALGINTIVLAYIASGKYKDAILSKSTANGIAMKREIEKVLSFGIGLDALSGFDEKLSELVNGEDSFDHALITTLRGKVLYHSNAEEKGETLPIEIIKATLKENKITTYSSDLYYIVSIPLVDAEDIMAGALQIAVRASSINDEIYNLILWAMGISLVSFLGSLGLVYFTISRYIAKPVLDMQAVAGRIAEGDLTNSIAVQGKDEIAALAAAINTTTLNLKGMLMNIRKISDGVSYVTQDVESSSDSILASAETQKKAIENTTSSVDLLDTSINEVSQSTEDLAESASNTSSSILQMSKSIDTVAEGARTFDESAQETAAALEEMIANIKQIAESLETLSSSSDNIATSIDEVNMTVKEVEHLANESVVMAEKVTSVASDQGMRAIDAAMEGMNDIKTSVTSLAAVINTLGKRSDDIGKILKVINEVTDQTNLLSLNAAILATQAGEHGKSFAVVADHIADLAERTAASTKEISSLISNVQDETRSSVKKVSEGIETVEKGLTLFKEVNTALSGILDSSRVSTEMSRSIQRATLEQSQVIRQITSSIKDMTLQIDRISNAIQEQNRGSKFIISITDNMKSLSHQMRTSTEEQSLGSKQITDSIGKITTKVEQIVQSTGQQRHESAQIVKSMETIREAAENLINSSDSMRSVISNLKLDSEKLLSEFRKFRIY